MIQWCGMFLYMYKGKKRIQMIEYRRHNVMCQTVLETKSVGGNVRECLEKSCLIIQKREGGAAAKL